LKESDDSEGGDIGMAQRGALISRNNEGLRKKRKITVREREVLNPRGSGAVSPLTDTVSTTV